MLRGLGAVSQIAGELAATVGEVVAPTEGLDFDDPEGLPSDGHANGSASDTELRETIKRLERDIQERDAFWQKALEEARLSAGAATSEGPAPPAANGNGAGEAEALRRDLEEERSTNARVVGALKRQVLELSGELEAMAAGSAAASSGSASDGPAGGKENAQLRAVIDQLRGALRQRGEELDGVRSELEGLRAERGASEGLLRREKAALEASLAEALAAAEGERARAEGDASSLSRARDALVARCEAAEQRCVSLEGDLSLAKEDVQRSEEAIASLQKVLSQFEAQAESRMARQIAELREASEAEAAALKATASAKEMALGLEVEEERRRARESRAEALEERDRYRDERDELRTERDRTRRALDEALARLHRPGGDGDAVDRRLVANLVLTLLCGRRPRREVLPVLADVLGFEDSECQAVGLRPRREARRKLEESARQAGIVIEDDAAEQGEGGGGGGGFLGGIVNLLAGPASAQATVTKADELQGNTVAEMWLDFMMKESEDDAVIKHKKGAPLGGGGIL